MILLYYDCNRNCITTVDGIGIEIRFRIGNVIGASIAIENGHTCRLEIRIEMKIGLGSRNTCKKGIEMGVGVEVQISVRILVGTITGQILELGSKLVY